MIAGLSASLLATGAANAEDGDDGLIPGDFSANIGGTTDYRFRGISQTDHLPAVQGGFDYEYQATEYFGVFAGIWASNVDFNDGDDAIIEIDYYGGFRGSIDKFSWQLQAIYYQYPGTESFRSYDYFEINPSVSYDFEYVSVTGGFNYSPNYFGGSGDAFYVYGEVAWPIPIRPLRFLNPTLSAHIGHQWIDDNASFGTPDYLTWNVGLSIEIEGFNFSIAYVDTDLGRNGCFGGTDLCGAAAVFTLSKTF